MAVQLKNNDNIGLGRWRAKVYVDGFGGFETRQRVGEKTIKHTNVHKYKHVPPPTIK